MKLTFPHQLDRLRDNALAQQDKLSTVANLFADALAAGGVVHIYANGHSRVTVEELVVRMGALSGFHALLCHGLANFTDVVGSDAYASTNRSRCARAWARSCSTRFA